jgi:glycosyltransferase involved in cell wall biosynthesis
VSHADSQSPGVVINARFQTQPLTGVQRVAREIVPRLTAPSRLIAPPMRLAGPLGHGWEQTALAAKARGRRLWSPCNSGPILADRHLVTLHDAAVLDHPEWFSHRFAGLYGWLWPRLAGRARIVTVSSFSRARLAERLGLMESEIAIVPNGVAPSFAPADKAAIGAARAAYGLNERAYFVTLSTLEPRKNLGLVLRAWRAAQPLRGPARLLVVGARGDDSIFADAGLDGPLSEAVVFTGRLSEERLPALISGARALIYPSLYEGFGLPVLEGMACGVPVVTTALASLPEVGGDAALYVDPYDADDLKAVMLKLLDNDGLVRERGARGVRRAALFSWAKTAKLMDALLDEL